MFSYILENLGEIGAKKLKKLKNKDYMKSYSKSNFKRK